MVFTLLVHQVFQQELLILILIGVTSGAFTFVEEGTVNSNNGFALTTDGNITIGTTALVF